LVRHPEATDLPQPALGREAGQVAAGSSEIRASVRSRRGQKILPYRLVAQRGNKGAMGFAIGIGEPQLKRLDPLPARHVAGAGNTNSLAFRAQTELRLPRSDQVDIDLSQQFGVEQCAVLGAAGIVDRIARAEIVLPVRHAGVLAPRQQQRVHQPVPRNG
jgi:hypothetical protein